MQTTARIQTRGRVNLPSEIRQALDVRPGDDLLFEEIAPGQFQVRSGKRPVLLQSDTRSRLSVPVPEHSGQLDLLAGLDSGSPPSR